MAASFNAFFLDVSPGERFCIYHPPGDGMDIRGAVLYVHPLAEELNRSRRMAALHARALAASGYAVLQIDLYGCGDSSGEFGEATWDAWGKDVACACAWLQDRIAGPLWIWGMRAGCLLGSAVGSGINGLAGFLFWQPVLSGRQCLQQLLRLKIAGGIVSGREGEGVDGLREQLIKGKALEIAGYHLSPALAAALDSVELILPDKHCRVECLEISAKADPRVSPALAKRVDDWLKIGHAARAVAVPGPPFWQIPEAGENFALIQASLRALEDRLT